MKKLSRKSLKTKCDKLFSLKVRERGKCELAGLDHIACNGNLQCMHVIGRANYNLRWDTINALCGCAAHHVWYTNHPWEWQELIKTKFPDRYEYINEYRNEFWDKDYDRVLEDLK